MTRSSEPKYSSKVKEPYSFKRFQPSSQKRLCHSLFLVIIRHYCICRHFWNFLLLDAFLFIQMTCNKLKNDHVFMFFS